MMAERAMVPTLEPWYVIPEQVVNVCKHARLSTGKARPMRNFLLRGPAGTGKTEGAKAIAAGLNLPYLKYTCSANTEVYDFIGSEISFHSSSVRSSLKRTAPPPVIRTWIVSGRN